MFSLLEVILWEGMLPRRIKVGCVLHSVVEGLTLNIIDTTAAATSVDVTISMGANVSHLGEIPSNVWEAIELALRVLVEDMEIELDCGLILGRKDEKELRGCLNIWSGECTTIECSFAYSDSVDYAFREIVHNIVCTLPKYDLW